MTEPDYYRAASAAYRMREKYDPGRSYIRFDPFLPLSVEKDLRVCRFTTFCSMRGIEYADLLQVVSPDGFSLRQGRRYIIVYNDAPHIPASRVRFTLAHELGHYTLGHLRDGDKEEAEANCFARNLLAPICFSE